MGDSNTITVRLTEQQEDLLRRLAARLGLETESDALAYILEDALAGPDAAGEDGR